MNESCFPLMYGEKARTGSFQVITNIHNSPQRSHDVANGDDSIY